MYINAQNLFKNLNLNFLLLSNTNPNNFRVN